MITSEDVNSMVCMFLEIMKWNDKGVSSKSWLTKID